MKYMSMLYFEQNIPQRYYLLHYKIDHLSIILITGCQFYLPLMFYFLSDSRKPTYHAWGTRILSHLLNVNNVEGKW